MIKPPRLRKGGLIGLVSPASTPRPREKIESGVRYFEGLGYKVRVGAHAANEDGFLAGTDSERAEDLNAMIRDPEVHAIFALRGGYGSGRILDKIDFARLRRDPKIISGFSDITALQLAIYKACRLVTFSGPMAAVEFWKDPDPYTEEMFWRLVTSDPPVELKNPAGFDTRCLQAGQSDGVLLGGNLSMVAAALGTRFCPAFRNAVLVLEDVDEAPYRVDRMLTQLRNAGARPGGVVFGKFTRCTAKDGTAPTWTVEEVQADFATRAAVPAFSEFQYGHVPKKLTIPFGVTARMDSSAGSIRLLEPAVS